MWGGHVTATEAYQTLSSPDVTVTNQSDKDTQLAKIRVLDDEAKEAFEASSASEQLAAGVSAVELAEAGFQEGLLIAAGADANDVKFGCMLHAYGDDWSNKGLTAEDVNDSMLVRLQLHAPKSSLNLSGNRFGTEGATVIAEFLKVDAQLTFLDLSGKSIGEEGMRVIGIALLGVATSKLGALKCDAFDMPVGATSLNLSSEGIGPGAATLLAGVVKFTTTLTVLGLGDNKLGPEGAKAIAESLIGNTTLTKVNLRFNSLDDAAKNALREAVKGRKGFVLEL